MSEYMIEAESQAGQILTHYANMGPRAREVLGLIAKRLAMGVRFGDFERQLSPDEAAEEGADAAIYLTAISLQRPTWESIQVRIGETALTDLGNASAK